MQTVTDAFTIISQSKLRKLNWKLFISWDKTFNSSATLFTIGSSSIGGVDIIKGEGNVIQEWDKYAYADYSNRVLNFEYTREQDPYIGGAILTIADITLDNSDNLFTPAYPGSPISPYILPWRPIRIFAGFGNEVIPVFVGLIENMPDVNDKDKTVRLHCIDFMQSLFNYPLDEAIVAQDNRTDQLISYLLQLAGLLSTQMNLDTGEQVIPIFFANKGDKLGPILRDLVTAEMGKLYMDENGMIKFLNRTNWLSNNTLNWTFNRANTIDRRTTTDDNIINVVEVQADAREVLDNQKYWESTKEYIVPANSSIDVWADFQQPVISVDDPDYIGVATTSLYETDTLAALSSVSTTQFAKSFLMTFTNSTAAPVTITNLVLFVTPAPDTKKIYAREEDTTSVTSYHERPLTISNNYIQDSSTAASIASMIIQDNKDFNPVRELEVIGIPQLQVGDTVRVVDEKTGDIYSVSKIVSRMIQTQFVQTLTVVKKTINSYFRIGISSIAGADKIAP